MTRSLPQCLLCLCLSLALALFGAFGAASAGGEARALVICGAGGPQVVMVDEAGKPLPAHQGADCAKCPACTAAGGVTLPPANALPPCLSQLVGRVDRPQSSTSPFWALARPLLALGPPAALPRM